MRRSRNSQRRSEHYEKTKYNNDMPTPQQEKAARDLIARGDALGQKSAQQTGVTYAPAYTPPQPAPVVSTDGSISASTITPAPQFELPQPTAPLALQQYQESLQGSVEIARANVEDTLAKQRDEAVTRAEEAYKRQQDILTQSDPRQRATYGQEQGIIQQQLNFAQHAADTLQKDFDSRRRIVNELSTLLNEGNSLIRQQQGLPVAQRVVQQRAAQAMQTVAGRAGILEAVIAGLDGNIALSHNAIDRASNAVRSQWQDLVAYNNALLQLEQNRAITIEEAHKTFATETLSMAKSKLAGLEDTVNYVKEAMINPQTAQDFAEAGITLDMSVDEISKKLGEQMKRREDRAQSEALALDALQNGAPADIAARMRAARTVEEAMKIGGQYVGAIARQQAYSSMASQALARRLTLIELAEKGDKSAIEQLGYNPKDVPLSSEEIIANENAYANIQRDIDKVETLKNNGTGLRASSGLFRKALNPYTASRKNDFLNGAQYVVKNLTFEKLSQLKEQGVNLTPISEKELKAVGEASSELASAARYDEAGNLIGFKVAEQRVYELLEEVQGGMFRAQQELNINLGMTSADQNELIRLLSGSQQ